MAQFPLSDLLDGSKSLATKIYNSVGELFTISNPAFVQLSGRNAVKITIINAVEIRSAGDRSYNNICLTPYKEIKIWARSSLDQPVGIFFQPSGVVQQVWNGTGWEGYGKYGSITATIPANPGAKIYDLTTIYPELKLHDTVTPYSTCNTAPTSGSLTLFVVGVLN